MLDRLPVGAVPLAGSSVVGHARKLADTAQGASQAATAATSAALPFHCKLLLQPTASTSPEDWARSSYCQYVCSIEYPRPSRVVSLAGHNSVPCVQ